MIQWAYVVGDDRYLVSSEGDVYSRISGRILRAGLMSTGYPSVVLGRGNTRLVHRLVAEAFLGACPEGCEVLHADGSRTNARLENLRYGTRAENVRDAKRHGTVGRDPANYYVPAKPCRRGHKLRYKSNGTCVECRLNG